MKKHKIITTLLALTLITGLTACGSSNTKKETELPEEATVTYVESQTYKDLSQVAKNAKEEIEKENIQEIQKVTTEVLEQDEVKTIINLELKEKTPEPRILDISTQINEIYKKQIEKADIKDQATYKLDVLATMGGSDMTYANPFEETILKGEQ